MNPAGSICHWTAGPRGTTGRPSLNICVNGRAGLPGPLCHVYLDRKGIAVVVAAGVSNHGGVGTWRGISGNSRFFGTEAECGGEGDWTAAQRDAYPRVNAAYCWLGKFGTDMITSHHLYATPAGRKVDVRDWPMDAMRAATAALLTQPPAAQTVEEDLPLNAEDLAKIRAIVDAATANRAIGTWPNGTSAESWEIQRALIGTIAKVDQLTADVAALRSKLEA